MLEEGPVPDRNIEPAVATTPGIEQTLAIIHEPLNLVLPY